MGSDQEILKIKDFGWPKSLGIPPPPLQWFVKQTYQWRSEERYDMELQKNMDLHGWVKKYNSQNLPKYKWDEGKMVVILMIPWWRIDTFVGNIIHTKLEKNHSKKKKEVREDAPYLVRL